MHALDTADKRMKLITLPTVPLMRLLNNDYLGDVVYYFNKFHCEIILKIVVASMNREYREFKEKNPDWTGEVSILGHSLGGIISYDILSHQTQWPRSSPMCNDHTPDIEYPQLDFKPLHLFTVGSPIGATMIMRGQRFESYQLPDDIQLLNIFHRMFFLKAY